MSKKVIVSTLSAVVAMGIGSQVMADTAATTTTTTTATTTKPAAHKIAKGMEKCFGIAKAGKNDCGSATEACAGQSKMDSAKDAWVAVPKGTCAKIVGGSTTEGSAA